MKNVLEKEPFNKKVKEDLSYIGLILVHAFTDPQLKISASLEPLNLTNKSLKYVLELRSDDKFLIALDINITFESNFTKFHNQTDGLRKFYMTVNKRLKHTVYLSDDFLIRSMCIKNKYKDLVLKTIPDGKNPAGVHVNMIAQQINDFFNCKSRLNTAMMTSKNTLFIKIDLVSDILKDVYYSLYCEFDEDNIDSKGIIKNQNKPVMIYYLNRQTLIPNKDTPFVALSIRDILEATTYARELIDDFRLHPYRRKFNKQDLD